MNPDQPTPARKPQSEADTVPPAAGDIWSTRHPHGWSPAEQPTTVPGTPVGPPLAQQLPAPFGRYRLLRLLGQGGMGSVYLAHDSQLDRQVALKVPSFGADADATLKERFFVEARSAATLLHANLCPVHDVGEIDGRLYLTMGFIEGKPLSELLRPGAKPLTQRQAAVLV